MVHDAWGGSSRCTSAQDNVLQHEKGPRRQTKRRTSPRPSRFLPIRCQSEGPAVSTHHQSGEKYATEILPCCLTQLRRLRTSMKVLDMAVVVFVSVQSVHWLLFTWAGILSTGNE